MNFQTCSPCRMPRFHPCRILRVKKIMNCQMPSACRVVRFHLCKILRFPLKIKGQKVLATVRMLQHVDCTQMSIRTRSYCFMKGTIVNSFSDFSTYLLPMNQCGLMEKTTTFSCISLPNAANNDNLVCVTVIVTLLILR